MTMIDREGARMLADVYNTMSDKQVVDMPADLIKQHSDFLIRNGYRLVFGRWYLQPRPSPYANR